MTTPHETAGDVDQLEAHVEQTRQELGQTVDALSAKLDVRSRTRNRLNTTRAHAAHGVALARQRTAEAVAGTREKTAGLGAGAKHAASDARHSRLAPAVPAAVAVVVAAVVVWRLRHR